MDSTPKEPQDPKYQHISKKIKRALEDYYREYVQKGKFDRELLFSAVNEILWNEPFNESINQDNRHEIFRGMDGLQYDVQKAKKAIEEYRAYVKENFRPNDQELLLAPFNDFEDIFFMPDDNDRPAE